MVSLQVHSSQIQMRQLCHRVKEMGQSVISLSELSCHIAYLMSLHFDGAEPALSGPVSAGNYCVMIELLQTWKKF